MRLFSQNEVCERALRKIGAFAIRSSGARPEELSEARYWLDMVVGHVAARKRTWWLVPTTGQFTLVPGVANYDLNQVLTPAQAPSGVQFVIGVQVLPVGVAALGSARTSGGTIGSTWMAPVDDEFDTPSYGANDYLNLPLVRREEWETLFDPTQTGNPQFCHVDRQQNPSITFAPVPDSAGPYVVRVLFQSYSPDFVSPQGNTKLAPMRASWNLWLVTALARELGNGPIRKLPKDEVTEMDAEARRLLFELESYDDHEQTGPGRTVFFNGI